MSCTEGDCRMIGADERVGKGKTLEMLSRR